MSVLKNRILKTKRPRNQYWQEAVTHIFIFRIPRWFYPFVELRAITRWIGQQGRMHSIEVPNSSWNRLETIFLIFPINLQITSTIRYIVHKLRQIIYSSKMYWTKNRRLIFEFQKMGYLFLEFKSEDARGHGVL